MDDGCGDKWIAYLCT